MVLQEPSGMQMLGAQELLALLGPCGSLLFFSFKQVNGEKTLSHGLDELRMQVSADCCGAGDLWCV